MSQRTQPYASVDQVRAILQDDSDVPGARFADLLAAVHSAFTDKLGYTFGGEPIRRYVSSLSNGDTELWLPAPGADLDATVTVVEDGETLVVDTDFEVDPDNGRFLLRLDEDGEPTVWTLGARGVRVTFTPAPPPDSLIRAEIIEVVRLKRGASGGFSDQIGIDLSAGSSSTTTIAFAKAFTSSTQQVLRDIQRRYTNRPYGCA